MNKRQAKLIVAATLLLCASAASAAEKYLRFVVDGQTRYGVMRDGQIAVLAGGLFPMSPPTGQLIDPARVEMLPPTDASKVFAVGMNFASHLASRANQPPPLFLKLPSALTGHDSAVVLPPDAKNVHFEGEMVLVIGKQAKGVSQAQAPEYIFGVTIGNDLSERGWQRSDLQWLRAKASDGFGPVGPVIATGLDYNNVELTTRVNGDVVQQENTRNMIHSPAKVVSFLSDYFTLEPGDLIFMGTPDKTRSLSHEDVVTVELEGVGVLRNRIVQE